MNQIQRLTQGISVIAFMMLAPLAWACDGHEHAAKSNAHEDSVSLTQAQAESAPSDAKAARATLKVQDMLCASCSEKIKADLLKVPGVKTVKINLKKGIVEVAYTPGSGVTPEALAEKVTKLGYKTTI